MPQFVLACDLGQAVDPTAICAVEILSRAEVWRQQLKDAEGNLLAPFSNDDFDVDGTGGLYRANEPARINVRHLERLPLRMNYEAQVRHIAALLSRPPLNRPRAPLIVDQTGVGRAVVDMLRGRGLWPEAVTITAGDSETSEFVQGHREYRVSKLQLVSRLQSLLHSGTLKISSKLSEAANLGFELQDFRATTNATGYVRFGAREGAHDDLVLALALACWWACRAHPTVSYFPVHI